MLGAVMRCLHFRPFGSYVACILYKQLHHKSIFLHFLNNICFSQIILLWKVSLREVPTSSRAFIC